MVIEQNGHDPLSMNGGGALALRVALSVNPLQAELWYRLAQFDATTGNPGAAVAILREGLRHCSDQPDLLYLLANCLHHIGELMEAIDTYRRCVTLSSGSRAAALSMWISRCGWRVMFRRFSNAAPHCGSSLCYRRCMMARALHVSLSRCATI